MFIAIVVAEVIKGVLIDIGHVNPGINKNSHVSRFLELLLKHWGFDVGRAAIAACLEELPSDQKTSR